MYVFDHTMESILTRIFLDKKEFVLPFRKHTESWRKLEKDRIKRELESVFPLLELLIARTSTIELIESTPRFIIRDNQGIVTEPFDTVDFSGDLDIAEKYSASFGAKVFLEHEFSIGFSDDFFVEGFEILMTTSEPLGFDRFRKTFFFETFFE